MRSPLHQTASEATRITCMVHQQLSDLVTDRLRELGASTVLQENARCVRRRLRAPSWWQSLRRTELVDAPYDLVRTTVHRDAAMRVMNALVEAADLLTPGHGTIYAQDIRELSADEPPNLAPDLEPGSGFLHELTLITGILSMSGSGSNLVRPALTLAAGVPVVSLGVGTGIRNRLGLLRITIPPEKELVHLVVPSHDAAGLLRLLVEEGRLDRPGGGFLYLTPIRAGVVDPLVRIGRQQHAATMEQVIAALDGLQRGTAWRKRFAGVQPPGAEAGRLLRGHVEVVFICTEGLSEQYVLAALRSGASGATLSRVRCLCFSDREGGLAARERGIICAPAESADAILQALHETATAHGDCACRLQVLKAPVVFSHTPAPRRSRPDGGTIPRRRKL